MRPLLILVNGPCGVGKTTFAKELQQQIPHSLLIEGDELRRWFEEHPDDRPASAERLREVVIQIASAQINSSFAVIFDKTIAFDGVVEKICAEVGEDSVVELVLKIPESEIHRRIEARGGYGKSLSREKAQQFIDYFKDYVSDAKHSITVGATQVNPAEAVEQINDKMILT